MCSLCLRGVVRLCCIILSIVFIGGCVVWGQQSWIDRTVVPYSEPSVPYEFHGPFSIHDDTRERVWHGDGRDLYLESYRQGWDRCLNTFAYKLGQWRYEPGVAEGYDRVQVRAIQDGWRQCSSELDALLANNNEDDIRQRLISLEPPSLIILALWATVLCVVIFAFANYLRMVRFAMAFVFALWLANMIWLRCVAGSIRFENPLLSITDFGTCILVVAAVTIVGIYCDYRGKEKVSRARAIEC